MNLRAPTLTSLVLAAGLLGGCASEPRPPTAAPPPSLEASPPPVVMKKGLPSPDVSQQERELAVAEEQIGDLLGLGAAEAPRRPSASTPPPTVPKPEAKAAEKSPCVAACSALASMTRSTEHLCAIAGNDDEHCTSARTRTARAGERVHASCPSCS